MQIVKLYAENFKRLRVVNITPDGNLVQITGANAQGKSSVLDAIWAVLGGAKAAPNEPVRRGNKRSMVKLDLGDLIVTRRFSDDGKTALQVEGANGKVFDSPQRVLDELLGRLTFDPLAFLRLKPTEQLELLRNLVTLEVDIDALDGANTRDFNARTELNREEKSLRAQADAIVVPDPLPPTVDTDALMEQIVNVGTTNAEIEQRRARRIQATQDVVRKNEDANAQLREADRLRGLAAEAEAKGQLLRMEATELQAKLDAAEPLPDPVDAADLKRQHDAGVQANKGWYAKRQRDIINDNADAIKAKAQALTDAMAQRTAQRTAAIANAKMPVPGIDFGEGTLLLNGLPFAQASGAEQLRTSIAVAMALNPKLRILCVREGSLLDENGIKLVADMAAEHGFQVWMEQVNTSGGVGIVMEDGQVKETHDETAAEPAAE